MSTVPASVDVEYPESDGQPMGETDLHIEWLIRLRDMLKHRYRDQQVYVAADLLLYYEEGVPRSFIVPDVFVVKDCDPKLRRIYKLWEEGQPPHVAFELTSLSSKRHDTAYKPRIYAQIGIREYFVYDPYGESLSTPLQGYRLDGEKYSRVEPDADGALVCEELNLTLRLDAEGNLVLTDLQTGDRILIRAESADQEVERLRQLLDEQSSSE